MTEFKLTDGSGSTITGWQSWSPPKHVQHWVPGRSAMECARAWFRTGSLGCPEEIRRLLESNAVTRALAFSHGRPEMVTALPMRGEGRNHDLWLVGHSGDQQVTVCIEAKADEPFGDFVANALASARRRNPETGLPARARKLIEVITGREADPEKAPWASVRYQLLTALAGTALQAQKDRSAFAVLVVHEFVGSATVDEKVLVNARDLAAFVSLLGLDAARMQSGELVGPLKLPESALLPAGMPIYVGKVQVHVETAKHGR